MKLSVISITYNNLEGLKKTLDLFLQQAHSEIELVVVDGGSKDDTPVFLAAQTGIQQWVSEPDKGIYNAMNKGLQMAKGNYVWFLNAGDYVESWTAVEALLKAIDSEPDVVYAETMMVDPKGKHLGIRSNYSTQVLPKQLTWQSLRMGMTVSHQSFVIKRSLALPYNETYRYVADIDWMIACLKACKICVQLPCVLANFTVDGFSSTHRNKSNKERYKVLQKHYGFFPNLLAHIGIVVRKMLSK
jgi:glycosyltransferase involved in cell wall biosynthesis